MQTFVMNGNLGAEDWSHVNFLYEGWTKGYLLCNTGQSYQVQTTPDLVRARENWAPHSIWQTLCPLSLSMFWGMLQPSLPPRPSFPKSPSPQENTNPDKNEGKKRKQNSQSSLFYSVQAQIRCFFMEQGSTVSKRLPTTLCHGSHLY